MATDPVEILNRRNAEVAKIRNYADLTEEAKQRRIAEVSERAQAEYVEAREAEERERAERLERAQEELGRILSQAERTGDKLLARAAYHRAIDLGAQGVVDTCLSLRPQENKARESYTAAHQEHRESRGIGPILERGLAERALSSEAAG
jgi:HD-GYP domain-containing protein (c-di-GMP phosphodiesterase class II)